MNDALHCQSCGTPLMEGGVLGDKCPTCLLELGLAGKASEPRAEAWFLEDASNLNKPLDAGTHVGRYRIVRPIGEGGMGAVYEALQDQPRRTIAMKVSKGGFRSVEMLHRFEHEAQALGRLQHPGIAQIYEAGIADTGFGPQPYFAMELISGLTPNEYAEKWELNVRERMELVAKMADAVHHAHQRGVIHRDLKPSNILVDESGQPKILDFGVARSADDNGLHSRHTEAGQLLGTVAYMSPEQVMADPHEIDVRTDVYALGVILYELLADRAPYGPRNNLHEALTAIREEDPAPLGTLNRDYRGDIETIVAKALEKDKTRRYTSAAELAADIRRYLSDEPIMARPTTATYQLRKFARRNKTVVGGVAAVIVVLLFGVAISTWQATRARLAQQDALSERDRSRQAEAIANEQRNIALDAQRQAVAAELTANAERDRANSERVRAQTAEEQARKEAATANRQRLIAVSQYLIREALRPETVREDYDLATLLALQAFRFSEPIRGLPRHSIENALQQAMLWNPLRHTLPTGGSAVNKAVAISPDGTRLAAGGTDQIIRVWDMGNRGAAPLLIDARSRGTYEIRTVAFSPDGKLLAIGSQGDIGAGTIRIWNLQNAAAPPLSLGGTGLIDSLAFSPDGNVLVSASRGVALASLPSPGALSIQPPTIALWNLRKPEPPQVLSRDAYESFAPAGQRVAFSPDGSRVAASFPTMIRVWDVQNPTQPPVSLPTPPLTPPDRIPLPSVAFSPDGVHLAVGFQGGAHIWDLRNLQAAPVPLRSPSSGPARFLTYGQKGTRLAAATPDIVWIWDIENPTARPPSYSPSPSLNGGNHSMAYSSDGTWFAVAHSSGVEVWDLSTRGAQPLPPPFPLQSAVMRNFVYSLTHIFDATGTPPRLWDLRRSPPRVMPLEVDNLLVGEVGEPPRVQFCKNDTVLALSSREGTDLWLSVWDIASPTDAPKLIMRLKSPHPGRVSSLIQPRQPLIGCALDGDRLAFTSGPEPGLLQLIDLGRVAAPPVSIDLRNFGLVGVSAITFSGDGNIMAIGDRKGVKLWSPTDPTFPVRAIDMPTSGYEYPTSGYPVKIALSNDGTRLAANEGSLMVWDLGSPRAANATFPHSSFLAFSPDGTLLATASDRGNARGLVRVWDPQNPGLPPLEFRSSSSASVTAISFSTDGLRLSAGHASGIVAHWDLWSAAADTLCKRVWRNLSMKEWQSHVGEGIPYERSCPALPPGARAPGGPQ